MTKLALQSTDPPGANPCDASFSSCSSPLRKGDPELWPGWIPPLPQLMVERKGEVGVGLEHCGELGLLVKLGPAN